MFKDDVLSLVKRVPMGKVTTYGEIGKALGTTGYRSVGQALRRNEHPIVIPCHRVVCSDGRVGGYCGKRKTDKKTELLEKEGIKIVNGRIDLEKHMFRF
ncbi:MAG: MGMT family protein [Candidatus Aenigmarchaeota archaeon]|nr:MGMT family protein [Candidatus Aenigmarchaeota archaeon]